MASQRIPVSTYRLQFNSSFRFSDARTIVPYLRRLGISDLYASPIFKATPGSTHGYDITDPTCFNPELGSEEEFSALVEELKKHGMGLLLDIVPNHLAASPDNPWWLDVLESGLWSPYADFFDINWNPIDSPLKNKILLPILGHHYRDALENGELVLALEDNNLFVRYYDYRLPLEIKSYGQVLSHNLDTLEERLDGSTLAVQQLKIIIESMNNLLPLPSTAAAAATEQYKQRQAIKKECRRLLNTSPEIKNFLGGNLKSFNGNKGKPASSELLEQLLAQQVYQLAYWKTAHSDINYRRFFDINDLIGIRVELPQVFAATHTLIFRLAREGKVTGLRVDHIDGLYDPQEYLLRLQENMSEPGIYTITEKILSGNETLPDQWPVCGTTGYDFINLVNSLFIDYKGLKALREHYSQLTGVTSDFCSVAYEKKKKVIEELFPGEISRLGLYLHQVIQQDEKANNLSMEELKEALIEVTACLPVYRTYIRAFDVSPSDKDYLELAFGEARQRCLSIKSEVWDSLKRVLSLDFPPGFSPEQKESWLSFVKRWQQLTGAVMAKGYEDTALYNYNCLISLNEVGGNPGLVDFSVDEFHRYNQRQHKHWPHTLNATSTHDTKRSEDVRARINVLSELPQEWIQRSTHWSRLNKKKKQLIRGQAVPEPNTEMFLYQTLLGAWPLSDKDVPQFKERIKAYLVKAVREAKAFTSWLSPNTKYEDALVTFTESILESSDHNEFLEDFLVFQRQIACYGALNSLAQVLVKATSPGVPDYYQGMELWDFSLVDPDNRRPVDFQIHNSLLDAITPGEENEPSFVRELLTSWQDGRIKLFVTYKSLAARRDYDDLLREGDYIPVHASGERSHQICAFIRHLENKWLMTVVPRLNTKLAPASIFPVGEQVWRDDLIVLPTDAPQQWFNVFTGENIKVPPGGKGIPISTVFSVFPLALLIRLA